MGGDQREHVGGCVVCLAAHDHEPEPEGFSRRTLIGRGLGVAAALGAAGALGDNAYARGGRSKGDGPRPPKPGRPIVLEPSWVLAYEDGELKLLADRSVVIEGNRIAEIGQGRRRGKDQRVRCDGQLLLAGFISGHTHVAGGSATRGIIEGGRSFLRPLEVADALDDDDLDDLTAFNLAELMRSGNTTQIEMALSLKQAKSYVRIAKRWGARGYPGGMVPGMHRWGPLATRPEFDDQRLFDSVPETLAEIQANFEFALMNNGAEDGRILPMMTPHATDTQTPETMQAYADAAAVLGNGIHIHLSQSARETRIVRRLWGKTPAAWLADFGFYDGPLFGAHMSGIDFAVDPPILRENGATYAHCPSGGGAGGGTQPWPEILTAGVNTNIGIDTHSCDYVENLKLAVLYGQARRSLLPDPNAVKNVTIWDAVKAATVNAADGLGRSDLGRIAVGAKADLVSIDVTTFLHGTGAPPPEPLNNLLYAHGLSVRHTMIDGNFAVFDGELAVEDEERVIKRGGRVVQKVWAQLAAEGWFTPTPV
jgi:cytosine/adenosine deaminase-related metal-dependent hydrolase